MTWRSSDESGLRIIIWGGGGGAQLGVMPQSIFFSSSSINRNSSSRRLQNSSLAIVLLALSSANLLCLKEGFKSTTWQKQEKKKFGDDLIFLVKSTSNNLVGNTGFWNTYKIRIDFLFILEPVSSTFHVHFFGVRIVKFTFTQFTTKACHFSFSVFNLFYVVKTDWLDYFFIRLEIKNLVIFFFFRENTEFLTNRGIFIWPLVDNELEEDLFDLSFSLLFELPSFGRLLDFFEMLFSLSTEFDLFALTITGLIEGMGLPKKIQIFTWI